MDRNNPIGWPGWTLGNRIGRGGFGNVYKIYRQGHGVSENAALKVITIPQSEDEIDFLRGTGMDDESISTQFDGYVNDIVREYKMMIGLKNCPNVVHVDDYMVVKFEDGLGWNIFLKMELLTPMLKALDHVETERQIIRFAMDLCNALIACQKKSVLHRDIKPQNIFLADDGCWKLGDFGVAKNTNHVTMATVGVGTYSYMAPEVLNGKPYGPSADLYSLGLVLYWLLNKRRGPFLPLPPESYTAAMDESAKQRRFAGTPLPQPATGSEALRKIVLKACAFDPSDRYASAQEMYRDLQKVFASSGTEHQVPVNVTVPDTTVQGTPENVVTQKTLRTEADNEKTLRTGNVHKNGNSKRKLPRWIVLGFVCAACLMLAFVLGQQGAAADGENGMRQTDPFVSEPPYLYGVTTPLEQAPEDMTERSDSSDPAAEGPVPMPERVYVQVDGGLDHTVVLYNDGTVEAVGGNQYGQCNVYGWTDIIQISTMKDHTVGLRADGTVVAAGTNSEGQCDVAHWTDIVAVSAGAHHTIGLRSDGTVVSTGANPSGECEVQGWTDIVAIGAAFTNSFGLRSDGTVIVSGSYRKGMIPGWENIQQISVSDAHIVGLCADGTVKAVGNNNHGQCDLADWKNIVSVAAGCAYTTGLKTDGTVLVKGINDVGQYQAAQWRDVAYIATGLEHTIGVKQDGTFVAAGADDRGQCAVTDFG